MVWTMVSKVSCSSNDLPSIMYMTAKEEPTVQQTLPIQQPQKKQPSPSTHWYENSYSSLSHDMVPSRIDRQRQQQKQQQKQEQHQPHHQLQRKLAIQRIAVSAGVGILSIVTTGVGVTTTAAHALVSSSVSNKRRDLDEEYRQGTAALRDMDSMSQGPVSRDMYHTIEPYGIVYADVRTSNNNNNNNNAGITDSNSSNEIVQVGSKVNMQWVLRKSNGYFVDSSTSHDSIPFIFTVGDGTAISGVDLGIRGMKVNTVRRLLIPPSLAYVNGVEDGQPGPIPYGYGPKQQIRRVQTIRKDVPGEYIYLEVQVTRIR
jgi:FKBP-type peptidyl-prolyl cis-trans isomerase